MADITTTAAKIGAVYDTAEIVDMIAAEAITKGQTLYMTSSGTVGVADCDVGAKIGFIGIALEAASIGKVVPVLKRGHVYGYDLSGIAYADYAYLSITPGRVADTSAGTTVHVGTVVALPDSALTKVLYIDENWG